MSFLWMRTESCIPSSLSPPSAHWCFYYPWHWLPSSSCCFARPFSGLLPWLFCVRLPCLPCFLLKFSPHCPPRAHIYSQATASLTWKKLDWLHRMSQLHPRPACRTRESKFGISPDLQYPIFSPTYPSQTKVAYMYVKQSQDQEWPCDYWRTSVLSTF